MAAFAGYGTRHRHPLGTGVGAQIRSRQTRCRRRAGAEMLGGVAFVPWAMSHVSKWQPFVYSLPTGTRDPKVRGRTALWRLRAAGLRAPYGSLATTFLFHPSRQGLCGADENDLCDSMQEPGVPWPLDPRGSIFVLRSQWRTLGSASPYARPWLGKPLASPGWAVRWPPLPRGCAHSAAPWNAVQRVGPPLPAVQPGARGIPLSPLPRPGQHSRDPSAAALRATGPAEPGPGKEVLLVDSRAASGARPARLRLRHSSSQETAACVTPKARPPEDPPPGPGPLDSP